MTLEAFRGSAATPDELVEIARGLGARVVTTEAGPRLFADLARAGLADELFLTLAPQLAGRDPAHPRLPLVDGEAFWAHFTTVTGRIIPEERGAWLFFRCAC